MDGPHPLLILFPRLQRLKVHEALWESEDGHGERAPDAFTKSPTPCDCGVLVHLHQETRQHRHELSHNARSFRFWTHTLGNHMLEVPQAVVPQTEEMVGEHLATIQQGHVQSLLAVIVPSHVIPGDAEIPKQPLAHVASAFFMVV